MFTYTEILLLTAFYTFHVTATLDYKTGLEYIKPEESNVQPKYNKDGITFDTKLADTSKYVAFVQDNGGNYGDLIYKYRENKDQLLVREVVVVEALSSNTQDIRWTVSIAGARISSVRVLNFGRERAFCLRIDVAGGDVQTILRVGSYLDPRIMIEIYGY